MKQRASFIRNGIKNFHPAYFAMVMATGIVSVAFEAMVFPGIAEILFVLNLIFYTHLMRHADHENAEFLAGFAGGPWHPAADLAFFNLCGGNQYGRNATGHIPSGQQSGRNAMACRR